ncbi:MAG TPA: hypothetical protein ENJ00_00050 [Phycisphaerales bacterium]|nr:hypothetical protein [Phycisphaerales bacterium]
MAKGQHLSRYQKGIVNRYYSNLDTITLTKLQELVSDLFLAEGKKAETYWKKAESLLARTDAKASEVRRAVEGRDVTKLAEIVQSAQFKPKK